MVKRRNDEIILWKSNTFNGQTFDNLKRQRLLFIEIFYCWWFLYLTPTEIPPTLLKVYKDVSPSLSTVKSFKKLACVVKMREIAVDYTYIILFAPHHYYVFINPLRV